MSNVQRLAGTLVIAALSGCSATTTSMKQIEIRTSHDPGASFPEVGSYSWMQRPGKLVEDARFDKTTVPIRMRETIERELARKGYEQRGLGYRVDFMVCYHFALEKDLDAANVARQHGYTSKDVEGPGQRFEKGSLIIDIVHPETKKLMWRGIAEAEIVVSVSEEEKLRRTNEAVKRILAKFPPK